MKLQVLSCNHHSSQMALRERLAFSTQDQLSRAYDILRRSFPASESVVISTCNRIELYTAQEDADAGPNRDELARFFSDFHQVPLGEFVDDLFSRSGPEAVRHLFEVTSSIDSMVLGEPQIVNQVKEAYRVARAHDACGPLTSMLFQRAIEVSKRVRSETRLAEGRVSIASVAVGEFGKSIFDRFDNKTVLVIGAGEMAEETLRYLKDEGVGQIVVVNRTTDRAEALARAWGGVARPWSELTRWLAAADVIVSTTGADRTVVDAATFRVAREQSGIKPVFILDLGVPRDFDPAVGEIDDSIFLYCIDDLERTCEENRAKRNRELEKAQGIIDEATERFMQEVYYRATGPVVKRLRDEWHEIRQHEVDQLLARLPHLTADDRASIERTIERIINKLLHPPLEVLKHEAREGPPHGLLDALKRLFHLRD
ncbi:MAG: glutamyl-tRNA reductase [Planctomycetes bacterium]|nr:glutamyl-tRNA reductase [Planctomycetota bacterium]